MRRFNPIMSTLIAAAEVHGMSAVTNCIKAYEREGKDRRACLTEAKRDLDEFQRDLDAAIAAETTPTSDSGKAIDSVLSIMSAI